MDGLSAAAPPDLEEIVRLSALDGQFFCHMFFPQTFRQLSPLKHREMWAAMDDPRIRLLNLRAFRGSAKTTLIRSYTAKRIAFGMSRTILYVGASEDHAKRSIQWLRTQFSKNTAFAATFGLKMGRKDTETELEVINEKLEMAIWVLGAGITGNIRGINFDDYRPDFIALDDPITDETAATKDQREKMSNLIHGALKRSLAPKSEEPNAKMVMAQTPIASGDAAEEAIASAEWHSIAMRCWTDETLDAPSDLQVSSWPERFPSAELRREKRVAAETNKLSIFIREMECRLTSAETSAFKPNWLKFREAPAPPMQNIIAVDPVPPPSELQVAKSLHGKDYEAIVVLGRSGHDYHVLDYALNRGHEPNWTVEKLFELHQRYHSLRIVFKPVAYERTLKWILEQAMRRKGYFMAITALPTKGVQKFQSIVNAISGIASNAHLWAAPHMTDLIEQFTNYPAVQHDDLLDAIAIGLEDFVNPYLELGEGDYSVLDAGVPDLVFEGRAP